MTTAGIAQQSEPHELVFSNRLRHAVMHSGLLPTKNQKAAILLFVELSTFTTGTIDGWRNIDFAAKFGCCERTVQRMTKFAEDLGFMKKHYNFRRPEGVGPRPSLQRASTLQLKLPGMDVAPPTPAPTPAPAPKPTPAAPAPSAAPPKPAVQPSMTENAKAIQDELREYDELVGLLELATPEHAMHIDNGLASFGFTCVMPALEAIRYLVKEERKLAARAGHAETLRERIVMLIGRGRDERRRKKIELDRADILRGSIIQTKCLAALVDIIKTHEKFADHVIAAAQRQPFTTTLRLVREAVETRDGRTGEALRKHVVATVKGESAAASPSAPPPVEGPPPRRLDPGRLEVKPRAP